MLEWCGSSPAGQSSHQERGFTILMHTTPSLPPLQEALRLFPHAFPADTPSLSPVGVAWAPGRVNLIGEHTDYTGGFALPLAVDRVCAFAGRTRHDQTIHLWSRHFQQYAHCSLVGLPATFDQQCATLPRWARSILAVATELVRAGMTLQGFDAVVTGDVPLGGGMSSSAALEVATAHACALFSQAPFTLSRLQIALLCQRAEQMASGVQCGMLDQVASCLGEPRQALLLDCAQLTARPLPFDAPQLALVVIDTGVRRELATVAYNERREQCEEALRLLTLLQEEPNTTLPHPINTLRDVTRAQFARSHAHLPPILRRRVGYILAENERVLQAASLLEQGHIEQVGPLLWQGHRGLRDQYEVSCPELDALVEIAALVPGVLGARMMGGGFGGCTLNLLHREALEPLGRFVEQQYQQRTGRTATMDLCGAGVAAGYAWVG